VGDCVCVRERDRRERMRVCIFSCLLVRLHMCACVCICLCMCVGMCVNARVHLCHVSQSLCICNRCICACLRVCPCVCPCACDCMWRCMLVYVRVHPQEEALNSFSNNAQTPHRQDHLACHRPFFDQMSLFFIVGAGESLSTCICMYQYVYSNCKMFVHRPIWYAILPSMGCPSLLQVS